MKLILKQVTGPLPTSIYDLIEDGHHIGLLQIRHKASASLGLPENFKSNIYYEINENERRKGYGVTILKLGLEEAKKLGLNSVVTICDEDNIGSKKIIEKNGGKLEDSFIKDSGQKVLKYKFEFQ